MSQEKEMREEEMALRLPLRHPVQHIHQRGLTARRGIRLTRRNLSVVLRVDIKIVDGRWAVIKISKHK
jgi:hypothetical protein